MKKIIQILLGLNSFNQIQNNKSRLSNERKRLRISVITPSTNIHGGTKRLIMISNLLLELGYEVILIRLHDGRELDWFKNNVPVIDVRLSLKHNYKKQEVKFPDCDILINYGNNIYSEVINTFSDAKGIKYNLFMHFGVHDIKLDIKNAVLKNFRNICTTKWIQDQLCKYDKNKIGRISFGISDEEFIPRKKVSTSEKFIIGSLYHSLKWKRSYNVISAFIELRKLDSRYELILFGQEKDVNLDPGITYIYNPSQEEIPKIYNRCHIWVVSSDFEGVGMCAVEAMLTKTPLLTTRTGGGEEFCNSENCTYIKNNNVNDIKNKIKYARKNYLEFLDKAEIAFRNIKKFKWKYSIRKLEDILLKDYNEKNGNESEYLITIGIPVYNEIDYVRNCIESVFLNTNYKFKLLIIDDNSNLETKKYLCKIGEEYENVSLIVNNEQKGFPYNCNLIITHSNSPYICFLNSDTIVTKDWLEPLIRNLRKDSTCMMVGPSTSYGVAKNYKKKAQQLSEVHEKRFTMSSKEIETYAKLNSERYFNKFEYTEYLNGFCMVIKKSIINEIGLFDTKFGFGSREEVQFIDRIKNCGYNIMWVKDSYVHHFGHRSFSNSCIDSQNLWKNNEILYKKDDNKKLIKVGVPKSKILFIFNSKNSSSTRKRTFEIVNELKKYTRIEKIHFSKYSILNILKYNIIYLQRIGGLDECVPKLFYFKIFLSKVLNRKLKIVYDLDDLILNSQNNYPTNLINLSNSITCSSNYLKVFLKNKFNKDVYHLPNSIDISRINGLKKQNKTSNKIKIVVFSIAGAGLKEFDELLQLLNSGSQKFEGVFYTNECSSYTSINHIKVMSVVTFDEMIKILYDSSFALNYDRHPYSYICKLKSKYNLGDDEVNDFVLSKSPLKYFNAAVTNTIFLTTKYPMAYSDVVREGYNGFYFSNVKEAYKKIIYLCENKDLYNDTIQNAKLDVESNHTLHVNVIKYLSFFSSLENKLF